MGAEGDLHPGLDHAIDHPNRGDRAPITVVVGVEDEGAQGGVVIAARRRYTLHHGLEQLRHTTALFCRDPEDFFGFGADQVVDFVGALVRLGPRQIDLVQDGYDFQSRIHGEQ